MDRTIPKEIKKIVDFVRVKENQGFKLIHIFKKTDGELILWFDDRGEVPKKTGFDDRDEVPKKTGAYCFDYLED